MGKRLKRRSVAAALLTLAVVATIGAGTANATSPAASGNSGPGGGGGGVKGVVTGGGGPSGGVQGQVASGGNGTLPFTGADLGLYGAAGVGMIGAGLLLRRASTRRVS
jgi:hypothetical protein